MQNRRGYVLLAGIADVYFSALCLGAAAALFVATLGKPLPLGVVFLFIPVTIISSVVYHLRFASRTRWLSPGERMHGRVVTEGVKQWANPWRTNRWALVALNLLALILVANTWDGLAEGRPSTVVQAIGTSLFVLLVALGLVGLGQGRPAGVFAPLLLYGATAGAAGYAARLTGNAETIQEFALGLMMLGGVHVLVVAFYVYRRRRAERHVGVTIGT
jgi:hypothetical protein